MMRHCKAVGRRARIITYNLNPKSRKGTEIMNHDERLELAKRLINDEINRTLTMWSSPEDLYIYAWGWRDSDTVGSNHGKQFFYAEEVVGIVKGLRLNFTLTICNNEDGEPTPAIHIW